jgi:hypothetical protein
LAAAVCLASPASAAPDPARIAITPASRESVLIARAPSAAVVYTLAIGRYDPVEQDLSGDWVALPVLPRTKRASDFVVQTVKPGTYVVQEVVQQGRWGVCFHAATLRFEVKPGQALYLGAFEAARPLMEIQRNAVARKELEAGPYGVHNYFDGITPPHFTLPADSTLPEVRAFMAEEMPKTKVAPVPAQFSPATFGTGRALIGSQRVCGGWHRKKDKRPDQPRS